MYVGFSKIVKIKEQASLIVLSSAWNMVAVVGRLILCVCISLDLPFIITNPDPAPSFVLLPPMYIFISDKLGFFLPLF